MKFENDPKPSCRKMSGLYHNFVMWVDGLIFNNMLFIWTF